MRATVCAISAVIGMVAGISAQAAVYTTAATGTPGDTLSSGDGFVTAYGDGYTGRGTSNQWGDTKVGDEGNPVNRDTHRTIYKMSLPTLAPGESVDSVTFSYCFFGTAANSLNTTPLANAEVVAYDSTTPVVVGSDWDNSASAITVSANELVWGVTGAGVRSFSGDALKQAVEQAYANGRDHVALRFQLVGGLADDSDTNWEVYSLGTSESGDLSQRPSLSITSVPEPAVIGTLCIGSLALLRRRRVK